jgi:hypothetical protein
MAARRGARRRGNLLTAAVLLAIVLGGTLPVPLYVRYEQPFGSGAGLVTGTATAGVAGLQPRGGGPPCDSWCSPELPVNTSARS